MNENMGHNQADRVVERSFSACYAPTLFTLKQQTDWQNKRIRVAVALGD